MKIYTSTEYISPREEKVGNLQLEVISMWDFSSNPVAFDTIYKREPNEKSIALKLKRCIAVIEPKWTKWEDVKIEDVSQEMIEEMERMGLHISDNLKPTPSSEEQTE